MWVSLVPSKCTSLGLTSIAPSAIRQGEQPFQYIPRYSYTDSDIFQRVARLFPLHAVVEWLCACAYTLSRFRPYSPLLSNTLFINQCIHDSSIPAGPSMVTQS